MRISSKMGWPNTASYLASVSVDAAKVRPENAARMSETLANVRSTGSFIPKNSTGMVGCPVHNLTRSSWMDNAPKTIKNPRSRTLNNSIWMNWTRTGMNTRFSRSRNVNGGYASGTISTGKGARSRRSISSRGWRRSSRRISSVLFATMSTSVSPMMTAVMAQTRTTGNVNANCQISVLKKKNSTVMRSSGRNREIIGASEVSSLTERRIVHASRAPKPT